MTASILLLIGSFVLIWAAAELFTNGIEWFGRRLRLGTGAVGSVLAAVGTALPETSISVVGVIRGQEHEHAGIGAILGAPMLLSTLAMLITGMSVLVYARRGKRTREIIADPQIIGRDLRSFFLVYTIAIISSFLPWRWTKVLVGLFLVGAYIYYVRRTFADRRDHTEFEELSPLHFHRWAKKEPHIVPVVLQLIAGLLVMVAGANIFLDSIVHIARTLAHALHPESLALVMGLIIAPMATELPEKMNSIIWIRGNKDTLALGNISGAMVFQSSITPAIGLFFTPWILNDVAIASAVIAVLGAATASVEMTLRKRISPYSLIVGGLLYFVYPVYVFGIAR